MGLAVLVVDDSPVTRRMVRRAVALCGLPVEEVHEAEDGAAALRALAARRFDLVLADLNMPVMSGIELVERMAQEPHLAAVPVVVVATPMSDAAADRLAAAGVRAFLHKPFRPEALRDLLARVLPAPGAKHA